MKWLLRLTLAFAALLAGAAFWLLGTESGLRWALGFAPPQLAIDNPRGALAREIRADRVAWPGIEARNVRLEVNLLALLSETVSVNFLRVDSLVVDLQKSSAAAEKPAARPPPLPLRIKVSDAEVKSLIVAGYEINDLKLDYAGGPLGHDLSVSLRAAGARARAKAALDASFRPKQLDAEVDSLNLAVIDPELPQTALRVRLQARGDEKTARGSIEIENPNTGPLDEDR